MNSKNYKKIYKNVLQHIKAKKNIKTRCFFIKTNYAIKNLIIN